MNVPNNITEAQMRIALKLIHAVLYCDGPPTTETEAAIATVLRDVGMPLPETSEG